MHILNDSELLYFKWFKVKKNYYYKSLLKSNDEGTFSIIYEINKLQDLSVATYRDEGFASLFFLTFPLFKTKFYLTTNFLEYVINFSWPSRHLLLIWLLNSFYTIPTHTLMFRNSVATNFWLNILILNPRPNLVILYQTLW